MTTTSDTQPTAMAVTPPATEQPPPPASASPAAALVDPRERTLGTLLLVLGVIGWVVLIGATFGVALIYLLIGAVFYLFAQSAWVAHLQNSAVRLSPQQFPDLHQRFLACCARLGVESPPAVYVMQGGGMLNAFALRFMGRHFVVLLSDVVDAMHTHPDGVDFYIGHELGHICRKHFTGHLWRWPALWLPLLGAAYSRAKERSCDLHGLACSTSPENAARALMALAAGNKLWSSANLAAYTGQLQDSRGFWSSFHELIGAYPWLAKRVALVLHGPAARLPQVNRWAYLPAVFVPFAGRLGGGGGLIVLVAVIGMLAAVALPAYRSYQQAAQVAVAWAELKPVRDSLTAFYEQHERPPQTLQEAGAPESLHGQPLELEARSMVVTVPLASGALAMEPGVEGGRMTWHCRAGAGLVPTAMPAVCR